MSDPPSRDDDTDPDAQVTDAVTVARCQTCGDVAHKGGDIVPEEKMVRRRWGFCAFGPSWSWCCKQGGKFKRR